MSAPLWAGLLLELRRRPDHSATVRTLARSLSTTPSSIENELDALRERGYEVAGDGRGRLVLSIDSRLCAEEIQAAVHGHLVNRRIHVLDEVTSTQDVARRHAGQTDAGGLVFFAEHQTAGHGRFGRSWQSPSGRNLLFSVVLRFPHQPADPSLVTVTASVAVCEALFESMNLPVQIKWPNDVLLADRKVAGVLVEQTRPRRRAPAYLVGIGLNVNAAPDLPEAISLAEFVHRPVDRTLVACELLDRLETWYRRADAGESDDIVEHWRRHSSTLGRRITLMSAGRRYTGRVLDMDLVHGLSIQTDTASILTFRPEKATLL